MVPFQRLQLEGVRPDVSPTSILRDLRGQPFGINSTLHSQFLVCHSAVPARGQIGPGNAISDMFDLGANETLFGCLIHVSHFAEKIGILY